MQIDATLASNFKDEYEQYRQINVVRVFLELKDRAEFESLSVAKMAELACDMLPFPLVIHRIWNIRALGFKTHIQQRISYSLFPDVSSMPPLPAPPPD